MARVPSLHPPPIPTGAGGGLIGEGAPAGNPVSLPVPALYKRQTLNRTALLARNDSTFTAETARVAAGRPKSKSLAPPRGVLPFLRPYRGRIAVAAIALVCSSTATLILPQF